MKLGVCYYPEHWPQDRWPVDARLMRNAGLSLVRIADFTWALMEPAEGKFTWNWLDQAIDVLANEGLQVILCTPTASPPPWMCQAYPDILPVDAHGRRRRAGSRRHYCPNSVTYRQHTLRIVSALSSRYGRHPAIVGWQIDNEFGCHDTSRCYCESCASSFRSWLEAKYESINMLNEAWGTVFWSQIYSRWDEINPPNLTIAEPNPSQVLDYHRFSSDAFLSYLQLQISTLHPNISEHQILTTNFMSQFTDLDYYDLAKPIDLVSMSSYPTGHAESRSSLYMPTSIQPQFAYDVGDPYLTSLGFTLMRGFKTSRPFWVMEQQCGNVNWSKYNTGIRAGTVRLWTWHALISGAEAVLYFRWRAGLYAQEQLHSGLLHHDGSPAVGYLDLETIGAEQSILSEIASSPHEAQIAILFDYDDVWALRLQPHHYNYDCIRLLFVYFRALLRLGLSVDILPMDADLSSYKLVIVPGAYIGTELLARSLQAYAEAGGTVLLGVRTGFKTNSNLVTDRPLPGLFSDLAGITVIDWHSLPPGVSYDLISQIPGLAGSATIWAEALLPMKTNAQSIESELQVLAHYTSGPFSNGGALVENKIGLGRSYYLGWHPTDLQAEALLSHLVSQVGIPPLASVPEGVIVSRRGDYLIFLNFTEEPRKVTLDERSVLVGSRDVEVIKLT